MATTKSPAQKAPPLSKYFSFCLLPGVEENEAIECEGDGEAMRSRPSLYSAPWSPSRNRRLSCNQLTCYRFAPNMAVVTVYWFEAIRNSAMRHGHCDFIHGSHYFLDE